MGDRGGASTTLTPDSLAAANDPTSVNAKVHGLEASITGARNEERWVDASLELERWVELTRYQHRTTGVPACQPAAARQTRARHHHQLALDAAPFPSPAWLPLAGRATPGSQSHRSLTRERRSFRPADDAANGVDRTLAEAAGVKTSGSRSRFGLPSFRKQTSLPSSKSTSNAKLATDLSAVLEKMEAMLARCAKTDATPKKSPLPPGARHDLSQGRSRSHPRAATDPCDRQGYGSESSLFLNYVYKHNENGKTHGRLLFLTNEAIYNLDTASSTTKVKRRVPLLDLGSLTIHEPERQMALHVPGDVDSLFTLKHAGHDVSPSTDAGRAALGGQSNVARLADALQRAYAQRAKATGNGDPYLPVRSFNHSGDLQAVLQTKLAGGASKAKGRLDEPSTPLDSRRSSNGEIDSAPPSAVRAGGAGSKPGSCTRLTEEEKDHAGSLPDIGVSEHANRFDASALDGDDDVALMLGKEVRTSLHTVSSYI